MRQLQLTLAFLAMCTVCVDVLNARENVAARGNVVHIQLDDEAITPAIVRFMKRALREAEHVGAECLVIELDTPGGVLKSTQQIVTDILASHVPVVVYVSPAGGRAASAGLFITLAGHVAAMTPGTRIGAAHPVQIGGLPITPPQTPSPTPSAPDADQPPSEQTQTRPSAMEEKLLNDTVAWARSLAELRGRNAEWVSLAVSESRVSVASEAMDDGVVDLLATDLTDLLHKIDGREVEVQTQSGEPKTVRIRTLDATIRTLDMWWGERLLCVISDPNVALVLMLFGFYGVLFELYSPGWGIAGTLGVVSLVVAFFGLSVLPINYAGLALIAIAMAMFVAEAFVTSFGALAVGGIVCLILGGTMLIDTPGEFLYVSLEVLVPIAVATGLITVFLVSSVVRAQRSRVQTGGEGLIGMRGLAKDSFVSDGAEFHGPVLIRGEWWNARSSVPVAIGKTVTVSARQGLTLVVQSADDDVPRAKSDAAQQSHLPDKGA
jgi:membrane-bound serine protease (ClpP class)